MKVSNDSATRTTWKSRTTSGLQWNANDSILCRSFHWSACSMQSINLNSDIRILALQAHGKIPESTSVVNFLWFIKKTYEENSWFSKSFSKTFQVRDFNVLNSLIYWKIPGLEIFIQCPKFCALNSLIYWENL